LPFSATYKYIDIADGFTLARRLVGEIPEKERYEAVIHETGEQMSLTWVSPVLHPVSNYKLVTSNIAYAENGEKHRHHLIISNFKDPNTGEDMKNRIRFIDMSDDSNSEQGIDKPFDLDTQGLTKHGIITKWDQHSFGDLTLQALAGSGSAVI
jgi:hypothetical protein